MKGDVFQYTVGKIFCYRCECSVIGSGNIYITGSINNIIPLDTRCKLNILKPLAYNALAYNAIPGEFDIEDLDTA